MKRIHLLRVEGPAASCASLVDAVRADGGRVGWLALNEPQAVPPDLEQAAALGVLRAVAVGADRTLSVKPRVGKVVLRDVLREHFRGCRAVLVAEGVPGEVDAPVLIKDGESWTVRCHGQELSHTTESLTRALRKPLPFGAPPEESEA